MAFPAGWGRKATVTIGAAQVSGAGALSDFPFLCTVDNLPSEMFDADGSFPALAGGGDIRFSSDSAGTNQLAIEVVAFTINNNPALGTAEIWVKAASIDDSDVFYVWYDKASETQPAVGAAFGRNAVWDGDHEGVWHLNGTTDSTGNGFTLTEVGSPSVVDGNFGKGYDLDGSSQHLTYSGQIVPDSIFTLEAFAEPDNATAEMVVLTIEDVGTSDDEQVLAFRGETANDYIQMRSKRSGGSAVAESTTGFSANTWHLASGTLNGDSSRSAALDGASEGTNSTTEAMDPGQMDGGAIGVLLRSSPIVRFNGIVEEARISSVVRTLDWTATNYNQMFTPGTFATAGTPETPGGGATVEVALTLTATPALTALADATSEAAVAMAASAGLTLNGMATAEGALAMQTVVAMLMTGDATVEGSMTLGSSLSLVLNGGGVAKATVSLIATSSFAIMAEAIAEGALPLGTTAGYSAAANAIAEGALPLGTTAGYSAAANATAEGALPLGATPDISTNGGIILEGALDFAETSGIGLTSDISIEAALAMALTSGVDFAGQVQAQATISLSTTQALGLEVSAVAEAGLDLATVQAMQVVAQALTEAGLSLEAIGSITIAGDQGFIVSIEVSPGRTIQVLVETRVVLVAPEVRVIAPSG